MEEAEKYQKVLDSELYKTLFELNIVNQEKQVWLFVLSPPLFFLFSPHHSILFQC